MTRPHKGSLNDLLLGMEVGEVHWVETTSAGYPQDMRRYNTAKTRRPTIMAGRRYTTALYTAIGTGVGNIRYLLAIERLA